MTSDTTQSYWQRCYTALGQAAHDPERVCIWCVDHPIRKELPKPAGVRERQVFISRDVAACLSAVAQGTGAKDALAESILLLWIKENIPDVFTMIQRQKQEMEAKIAELRRNEPGLEPQEDRIAGVLKSDLAHYENP